MYAGYVFDFIIWFTEFCCVLEMLFSVVVFDRVFGFIRVSGFE